MGRRYENWISKANTPKTRKAWIIRWSRFTAWATTTLNPLTDHPFFCCPRTEIDEVIRTDFESQPSHLFQDKYRNLLLQYLASLSSLPSNTTHAYLSGVRSFFSNETAEIHLGRGRLPAPEMAMNEHRFTYDEFHRMWVVGDIADKARLSVSLSLGWSVGDFLALDRPFLEAKLAQRDAEGYVVFDYVRKKTRARVRAILNPCAVDTLLRYFTSESGRGPSLWNVETEEGMNRWLRRLVDRAQIRPIGTVRFHLIRKYVFDCATAQCGPYEAKLLVGKKIPVEDQTYLHGLEDRLFEKYRRFLNPYVNLEGQPLQQERSSRLEEVSKKLETMETVLEYLQRENVRLRETTREIETVKRDSAAMQTTINHLERALGDLESLLRRK